MRTDANGGFGARLRACRSRTGLTLRDLAKLTKRSISLLSQIENGKVTPSFATMRILADVLNIPLGSLITSDGVDEEKQPALMAVAQRKVLTTQGGVQHHLLSRNLALPFEFISVEIPAGSSTGEKPYSHDGVECGLLVEGELEIHMGRRIYRMKPGDTITLNSSVPHNLVNRGRRKARAVWVNSVPMIFSTR